MFCTIRYKWHNAVILFSLSLSPSPSPSPFPSPAPSPPSPSVSLGLWCPFFFWRSDRVFVFLTNITGYVRLGTPLPRIDTTRRGRLALLARDNRPSFLQPTWPHLATLGSGVALTHAANLTLHYRPTGRKPSYRPPVPDESYNGHGQMTGHVSSGIESRKPDFRLFVSARDEQYNAQLIRNEWLGSWVSVCPSDCLSVRRAVQRTRTVQ